MNVIQDVERRAAILPLLVAAAAFLLYMFCLAPSVSTGGDSGELIASSYRLGVAHPSGYALYCLLAKAFTFIPFGEIGWRVNLLSAVCGAATAGVVTHLLLRHFLSRSTSERDEVFTARSTPAALGAGLLLAGFIFFGAQSLIAEVYAPTGLAIALLILCAARWDESQKFAWLCALAVGLGLALNLHLSSIFLWPGLLLFFALHYRNRSHRSTPVGRKAFGPALLLAACFLIGLSVTLYLPLRAAAFPEPPREVIAGQEYSWWQPLDWGHPADFARWKAHVSVQQYKSLLWQPLEISVGGQEIQLRTFAQSPGAALNRLKEVLQFFGLQWLWSTPLVVIGAIAIWREKKQHPLAALLATAFALNVFIAIHYRVDNVFDIANFLFPSYIVMAMWLGIGAAATLEWTARCGSWHWRASMLLKLALFAAVFVQWILFANAASWRGNTRARDDSLQRAAAVEQLQRATGQRATLLLFSDDALFPFWYAQHVLNRADGASTPYGPALHAYEEQKQLPVLTARFLKSAPVATAQWREELDAKFPYAPLTETGNLWRLTTGVLPPAAVVIPNSGAGLRGKFLKEEIRRGELVGFQAEFAFETLPAARRFPRDVPADSLQIGWIEVLTAPRTTNLKPFPGQRDLKLTSPRNTLLAFKQARRLVVPQNIRAGQALRATVPLQIPLEMPPGECDVWLRIVLSPEDTSTPWTQAAPMKLIVR